MQAYILLDYSFLSLLQCGVLHLDMGYHPRFQDVITQVLILHNQLCLIVKIRATMRTAVRIATHEFIRY